MKHFRIIGLVFLVAVLGLASLEAQAGSGNPSSLKGMSFNGTTGLFSIPSGRIGWERSSNLGLDLGYHTVIHDKKATHIPKIAFSIFKWVELHAAFDIQPNDYLGHDNGSDFITGAKVQFPLQNVGLALGGNFQVLNTSSDEDWRYKAGQVYVALSYAGKFFDVPAETTVVIGKTFVEDHTNWDIDFGMGFDIVVWPKALKGVVHWVTDFSNFSYSVEAYGAEPWYRGVLNTGLRFDLSVIPPLSKFKFAIDVLLTDCFDENRAFSAGLVFGVPIL